MKTLTQDKIIKIILKKIKKKYKKIKQIIKKINFYKNRWMIITKKKWNEIKKWNEMKWAGNSTAFDGDFFSLFLILFWSSLTSNENHEVRINSVEFTANYRNKRKNLG